jgi:hypothetical protein
VTDEQFLRALESCALSADEFGHAGHVRACYLYLRSAGFASALDRISSVLRRYALVERGDGGTWEKFAQQNPELFAADLLLNFYPRALLESDKARRLFILPRREAPTS